MVPGLLGFGLMRLPAKNGHIDKEEVSRMADLFIENGFNYFDTAYVYNDGESENAFRECVAKRHDRSSFLIADKIPLWKVERPEDLPRITDELLERCGVEYLDYLLLHSLHDEHLALTYKLGAWDYLRSVKEQGLARNVGFSFHDTPPVLEKILSENPWVDFVQLQINYADWDSPNVNSRECYETAIRHGKKIVIMEPIKGGSLVTMPDNISAPLKQADPSASLASWALRYAASLPGVLTVLSGMSEYSQMEENISVFKNMKPLSEEEKGVLAKVAQAIRDVPTVPCTRCKYCMSECPQHIEIPNLLGVYNEYRIFANMAGALRRYRLSSRDGAPASACIACRSCENICPQHIEISRCMAEMAEIFEDPQITGGSK
ncbi:MAG: aldo/keto reductase [Oscillospiraceae bacterium]|nr:aldo/keto reductase [Oscillospiraceae bacterium]